MISIRPMICVEHTVLRDIRLRALADTPLAFGSTYARESAWTDEQWQDRAAKWNTPGTSTTIIALDGTTCIGIIGCHRAADRLDQFAIVSMWVAPQWRRREVARQLLDAAQGWALTQGARQLVLDVTENNEPAIQCYKCFGFELTGESSEYPNAPNLRKLWMRKHLAPISPAK